MNRTLLLLLLVLVSCENIDRDKLRQDFNKRLPDFNIMVDAIKKIYVEPKHMTSGIKITLLECATGVEPEQNEICLNGGMLRLMRQDRIKKIWLESTTCDDTPRFDKMYFETSSEPPVVYLYDFCGGATDAKNDESYQVAVDTHWSVIVPR